MQKRRELIEPISLAFHYSIFIVQSKNMDVRGKKNKMHHKCINIAHYI